jgi:hypothetical protein
MKIIYIYGLVDPINNEIKYIGKSNNVETRLKSHLYHSYKNENKTYKERWICNLKKLNLKPNLIILKETNDKEYEYWEMYYIKFYKDLGYKLTNYDEEGKGALKYKSIEYIKNMQSKRIKNVYQFSLDGEFIKKYISAREAARDLKISHANIVRCCNKEFKHSSGFIFSYEFELINFQKIENPNAVKKIVCEIDNDGNIINEFISISEASKMTGIDSGNISRVCNNKRKMVKKRIFKFK